METNAHLENHSPPHKEHTNKNKPTMQTSSNETKTPSKKSVALNNHERRWQKGGEENGDRKGEREGKARGRMVGEGWVGRMHAACRQQHGTHEGWAARATEDVLARHAEVEKV